MNSRRRDDDPNDAIPEVVPDFTDDIRRALRVLIRSNARRHEEFIDLMDAGVSSRWMALRLYQFIPIAWGRILLQAMGVYCPDEYFLRDRRGQTVKERFSECELYQQIREIVLVEFGRASTEERDRLLALSAEISAFRQQIKAGAKPADLMLGPPIFM